MDHRTIKIQTALGEDSLEVVLIHTVHGWTANLLPRPGYTMFGSAQGATPEEALDKLTRMAQRQYEDQVESEVARFGPRQRAS